MTIFALTACKDVKQTEASSLNQAKKRPNKVKDTNSSLQSKQKKEKSSLSLLGQMHSDTVLRQVRIPRYDENFKPLSLLHADRMEVINGNTVDARDVTLELYADNGEIQASTKVKRATYKENDAILNAEEAIYISGKDFQTSGAGMVYDINTGQGFIIGPAASLFHLKSKPVPESQR